MNSKYLGILAILLASIMWSIEPIFVKLSYENSTFFQTAAIRAIFAGLIAFIYILITNKASFRVNKQQLSILMYIALVGTIFADVMYYFSLTLVPVLNAVLLGHMQPIFIILIGFVFLKSDKLTRFDYLGIFIMMLSGLLVTTKSLDNLVALRFGSFGDLIVLTATIAWATTAIAMRKYLPDVNAGVISFYRFLPASIVFVVYLGMTSSLILANVYQVLLGLIIGVGTILYYEGLKRLKAAQVSALELSTPFFAAVLGYFVLHEYVSFLQIFGIGILVVGIFSLSKKE